MPQVDISKITPHHLNERIYQISDIEDLKASMNSQGLLVPLVVNQNYEIISGHRRFVAACSLGWKTIEINRIKTTMDEIPKLIIHYNKQRIKTAQELLNEYDILFEQNLIGQGKRNDLTSGKSDRSSMTTRDIKDAQTGYWMTEITADGHFIH